MVLRFLLTFLVELFVLACSIAQGPPTFTPVRLVNFEVATEDFAGNVPASDSQWFYLSQNGTANPTAKPEGGGVFPDIEYVANRSANASGVVYTRGTNSLTVTVAYYNDRLEPVTGHLTWQGARLAVPSASGRTDYIPLTVSTTGTNPISVAGKATTSPISLTITGLPNYVALGTLQVEYDMPLNVQDDPTAYNNGTAGGFEGLERLYIVDQAPVGLQAAPWTDFLESSCRWAFGAVGQADMKQKMTYGMHYSTRSPFHTLTYNLNLEAKFVKGSTIQTPNPSLRLKNFVVLMDASDTQQSTSVAMQCADWGAILDTAFASQGYSANAVAYFATDNNGGVGTILFQTNPLCPPQYTDTVAGNYGRAQFKYHVVVTGSVGGVDSRFDASNSYEYEYSSGATYMKPAVAWPFPDFLYGSGGNGHGLIDHFLTPDQSGSITTVDYTSLTISN